MSKKSFNDIEAVIRHAMETNEPAFNESAWTKMEALLDKGEDRRRPFVFWLWILIPMLIVSGGLGFYAYNKNNSTENEPPILANTQSLTSTTATQVPVTVSTGPSKEAAATVPAESSAKPAGNELVTTPVNELPGEKAELMDPGGATLSATNAAPGSKNSKTNPGKDDVVNARNRLRAGTGSKTNVSITPASAAEDIEIKNEQELASPAAMAGTVTASAAEEDLVVVKVESGNPGKKDEKEIEKIVDSVIGKTVADKKDKQRSSRFFVIVAAGAEGSGTRLLSVDKITSRIGLAAGYNINSRLSVQAGFFVSSKKYKADGSSYKAKPGTYWSIVDIKEIEANCRVYEIPVQVNYNFTPGKKLNIFGSVGLSSYIMKKEDYEISYSRYGTPHRADAYYSGNKNLFSVLRLAAGVEKKLGDQFSVFAAPGVAIPLAGVGEGEVKLYSAEVIFGIRFTPSRKNK